MTIRKEVRNSLDLNDRINEYHNIKVFLNANKDELNELQKRLANGDLSVKSRVLELFDMIDEKNEWIKRNVPIIKSQMAS